MVKIIVIAGLVPAIHGTSKWIAGICYRKTCNDGEVGMKQEKDFYVYMMATDKNGTIYKGMTSNLIKRIWEHREADGSKFTTKYDVKKLVWYHQCGNWEDAVKWEKKLRWYKRQWKINLIEEMNPGWNDLWMQINGLQGQAL